MKDAFKILRPECLDDLDLFIPGDIVAIELDGKMELRVCYDNLEDNKPVEFNGLEFMKHRVSGSAKFVHSLYLPKSNLKIHDGVIKVIDPILLYIQYWWERSSDINPPEDYSKRKQIIDKSGVEKWGREW